MGTTTKSRATICRRPEEPVILIWIKWLPLRMRGTYAASSLDSHLECPERNQVSDHLPFDLPSRKTYAKHGVGAKAFQLWIDPACSP